MQNQTLERIAAALRVEIAELFRKPDEYDDYPCLLPLAEGPSANQFDHCLCLVGPFELRAKCDAANHNKNDDPLKQGRSKPLHSDYSDLVAEIPGKQPASEVDVRPYHTPKRSVTKGMIAHRITH